MIAIAAIVEGDGEVAALPVLLRRMGEWLTPGMLINLPQPIRVRRDRFLRRDEQFERYLLLLPQSVAIMAGYLYCWMQMMTVRQHWESRY